MTPRFTVLPAADRDLDDQADYLAEHAGEDVASRFYDAVDGTFAFLAQNPNLGAPRKSLAPKFAGVRLWRVEGFPNHVVIYRPAEDGILIIRVVHAHRDFDAILGPEA